MNDVFWGAEKGKKSGVVGATDESKTTVEVVNNHIFFYNGVDYDTALSLNKNLYDLSNRLLTSAKTFGYGRPLIHLHINSGGGFIHAGTAIVDTILKLKTDVDIYTYVEGRAASAATLISVAGTKRFVSKNSHMLIHQLSAGVWGTYHEIDDHKQNVDLLMEMIKDIYSQYTKVPSDELDGILKHDLYWDSKKCLALGLVDEIV